MPLMEFIEVNGLKMFEHAAMPAPAEHVGALDDSACFMYIVQGSNTSIETFGSTSAQATEGLLKRCSNYISKFVSIGETNICEAVAIYFHPSFVKKIYKNEIPDFLHKAPANHNTRVFASNEFIQQYITNLLPYFNEPELMDEDLATLKIKELIHLLLKSQKQSLGTRILF
jgi:hypothetical protein